MGQALAPAPSGAYPRQTMSTSLRIGQLAERVGVPVSTIRYYERRGLLRPDTRTDANYRLYDEGAVERLRFVRAAQTAGLKLEEIRQLLSLRDGGAAPCGEVRELLDRRLTEVAQQIRALRSVTRTLERWRASCASLPSDADCPVLDELELPGDDTQSEGVTKS